MSIKLKDLRTRIARYYPGYFDACFAKVYDKRALDTVVDTASVAMIHIRGLEKDLEAMTRTCNELRASLAVASVKAGEGTVEPAEPAVKFFVRLEDIPGARRPDDAPMTWQPSARIIELIKSVRKFTDMGLKEAKDVVDYAREGRGQTLGPFTPGKAAALHSELVSFGGKSYIQPVTRA